MKLPEPEHTTYVFEQSGPNIFCWPQPCYRRAKAAVVGNLTGIFMNAESLQAFNRLAKRKLLERFWRHFGAA